MFNHPSYNSLIDLFPSIISKPIRRIGHKKHSVIGAYKIEEILNILSSHYSTLDSYYSFENCTINLRSRSLKLFHKYRDNLYCSSCGLEASHWMLERYNLKDSPHFALYGFREENRHIKEYLFTIDHVLPLSRGGVDNFSNMQIMCYRCNIDKDDNLPVNSSGSSLGNSLGNKIQGLVFP